MKLCVRELSLFTAVPKIEKATGNIAEMRQGRRGRAGDHATVKEKLCKIKPTPAVYDAIVRFVGTV